MALQRDVVHASSLHHRHPTSVVITPCMFRQEFWCFKIFFFYICQIREAYYLNRNLARNSADITSHTERFVSQPPSGNLAKRESQSPVSPVSHSLISMIKLFFVCAAGLQIPLNDKRPESLHGLTGIQGVHDIMRELKVTLCLNIMKFLRMVVEHLGTVNVCVLDCFLLQITSKQMCFLNWANQNQNLTQSEHLTHSTKRCLSTFFSEFVGCPTTHR